MKRLLFFLALLGSITGAVIVYGQRTISVGQRSTVNVNVSGVQVLGDSLATDYGIQPLGTAWIDSAHVKNGAVSGADLINPLRVPTYNVFALNLTLGDSAKAKSLALTSYLIANGASIFRSGTTTTGAASADTTKGTNAAFTGYGIVNGAFIARTGATITGTATATTLTATGRVNVGTIFKLALNATLPDTSGFVGGETWYSAIGDTTYTYKSDHTIRSVP